MPRPINTHEELEVKVVVADLPELLARFRALGVKPKGRVLEQNIVFDTENEDLRQVRRLLRLRTEAPAPSSFAPGGAAKTIVTSKMAPVRGSRAKSRYKVNLETEMVLKQKPRPPKGKRRAWDRGWPFALGCIGLRVAFRYEKYRTTFRMEGVHVDLDETPIGVFLELEGHRRAIDRAAHKLGFVPKDYIRATYYDLYVANRRRKGHLIRNMVFPS